MNHKQLQLQQERKTSRPCRCTHGNAEIVDQWREVDENDYGTAWDVEYTVYKYECCDCGKTWIDTR